jgi:hypothetical protein
MRGFLLLLVLALGAAGAAQASPLAAGDGTLSLRNATGTFTIVGKGSAIGQLDRGAVVLDERRPAGDGAIVSGYQRVKDVTGTRSRYMGQDMTFRVLGGSFVLVVQGTGIDLSFVGRGTISFVGARDGTVSLDGGDTFLPLDRRALTFSFPPGP